MVRVVVFSGQRKSGTLGSSNVSVFWEGGEAEVFEVFGKVVLGEEAVLPQDESDAEKETVLLGSFLNASL